MQNIFTPFLSYSLFSLFFFVQTILSPTPKIIQPNPISKPSHISILYHNPPQSTLTFSYRAQHQKKKSQSSSNSTPPPPQFWKRAENCKFFSSTVERQPTRSNSASLDKPFFFFLVGLKLFLVALVYLTLACQLLSTPFSIVEKKKGKKGTFPRVNVCVRVWSSAENTVLRWLRVTFHEIFARTPHVLTLVSRFVHVAPRRGLTGREN